MIDCLCYVGEYFEKNKILEYDLESYPVLYKWDVKLTFSNYNQYLISILRKKKLNLLHAEKGMVYYPNNHWIFPMV